ncbi:MAG: Aconitate hydratase mitochondrial [Watsoniomyces obsoletus]|nr:MAG: Aconitate hydratase mitochondrial [Watsoniomyces obsoletus]
MNSTIHFVIRVARYTQFISSTLTLVPLLESNASESNAPVVFMDTKFAMRNGSNWHLCSVGIVKAQGATLLNVVLKPEESYKSLVARFSRPLALSSGDREVLRPGQQGGGSTCHEAGAGRPAGPNYFDLTPPSSSTHGSRIPLMLPYTWSGKTEGGPSENAVTSRVITKAPW